MATIPRILTYEEWLRMPPVEDGTDEVVRGELRFMPPTRYPHAETIRRLHRRLDRQVDDSQIIVQSTNFGLMISRDPLTCRSPDLMMYWLNKMVIQDGLYCSPPGLVVEVISPSETTRSKEEKLDDYASIGVPEVWLFSPQARSAEIRLLSAGKLQTTKIVVEGNLEPTQFPGVSVDLAGIWPE